MPRIRDSHTAELIEPASLFGKDAPAILEACSKIYEDRMYPYKGCYHLKLPEMRTYIKWIKENPDELEKVKASKAKWEHEHNRQFRIIYGIAKRHGIYLERRKYYVEQWAIYRKHKLIAIIHCA